MDIGKVEIENFMAIGHIEANLSNKGLVLIQGENVDDSSQDSNGSGKSSFPDALSWCLFGVTARGETGDKVINRLSKKNCRVSVHLVDGDDDYIVTRHRKYTKLKNSLKVVHVDKKSGVETDVTGGTDKITQEMVQKALGCSQEVFNAAIYAGQDAMPDLPGMTDKQLKQLIEESAGTELLQEAHQIAKERLASVKSGLESQLAKVASESERIKAFNANITDSAERQKHWEKERMDRLAKAVDRAKECKSEAQVLRAKFAAIDMDAVIKEHGEAVEKIDALSGERDIEATLEKGISSSNSKLAVLKSNVESSKRSCINKKKSLESVEEDIGEPCGSCGKLYDSSDLDEVRQRRRKTLSEEVKTLKEAMASVEKLDKSLSKQRTAISAHRLSMTDITAVTREERALSKRLEDLRDMKADVEGAEEDVVEMIAAAKAIKAENNPFESQLIKYKSEAKSAEKSLKEEQAAVKTWESSVLVAYESAKVYGPAGVRAHILDMVTPFLNNRTAHYLSHLTDGNISAIWSTLTATAKGDLREKFTIDVKSITGAETFKGLSGGEKRKVRLACSMALQDLVASRASKPISLYIADEIDHALDESGLERLMAILDEKAKERGTVLTISHNSLSDWIRSSVTVKKEAGYASMEGAALC